MRRRAPSLASQYDSLFEGADWYNARPDADEAKQSLRKSPVPVQDKSSAGPAATEQLLDDIAAQKQRMLEEFLHGLPPSVAPAPAAAPAAAAPSVTKAAAESTVPSSPAAHAQTSGGGNGSGAAKEGGGTSVDGELRAAAGPDGAPALSNESPRSQLVRSFMSELAGDASTAAAPACASLAELTAVAGAATASAAASALACPPMRSSGAQPHSSAAASQQDGSTVAPHRRGPRLRLQEMRVCHVLSCLRRLGLQQYAPAFERSNVDGAMCDFLDDELLEFQLGVSDPAHRHRFLAWVAQMQWPGDP